MLETIYTIPVNEVFEESISKPENGCPFCRLYEKLENKEIDFTLGAAMMEPDVRQQTNRMGFCHRHTDLMFKWGKKLPFALVLESHLDELKKDLDDGGLKGLLKTGKSRGTRLEKLGQTCFVCSRIDSSFDKMVENAVYLWEKDKDFRKKVLSQPYFCLSHYKMFMDKGREELGKKAFPDFYDDISKVTMSYLSKLKDDVSWFCKKFDYRYEAEPWGDSKDSIDRAVKFLR